MHVLEGPRAEHPSPDRLHLDERLPLPLALGWACSGAIGRAREMARTSEAEPIESVHEYRKALHRVRAVVRLVQPLVGKRCTRRCLRELHDALAGTAGFRDDDVLLQTLEKLQENGQLSKACAEARRCLLAEARPRGAPRLELVLRHGLQAISPIPERLSAELPSRLRRAEVREAVAASYRRLRAARRRADELREDEALHAFRKRVKEIRYQLELLGGATGRWATLAEELGGLTDLMLLRRWARGHRKALPKTEYRALVRELDRRIARGVDEVIEGSERRFRRKATPFVRRALRRRDQSPNGTAALRSLGGNPAHGRG
ncbi:MAG TPA: CHAD domain-containing protein [Myxococcales bacterium]|jgi:CHAD domain-containing protein